MMNILVALVVALGFRIRGGLGERSGHKLPANKLWFGALFACCACAIRGWDLNYWLLVFISCYVAVMFAGWGEYVGCALGVAKPQENRSDFAQADEFLDVFEIQERDIKIWKWNIHIPHFKLIEHPILFGVAGLTMRGLFMSFVIGLSIDSIPFMLTGAAMGIIYWVAGWLYRKGIDDGKSGWNIGEWLFGFWEGLCLAWWG